jgi:hypothetical protein
MLPGSWKRGRVSPLLAGSGAAEASGLEPATEPRTPDASGTEVPGTETQPALEWTFNPWRQDLRRAAVGAVTTAAAAILLAGAGLPAFAVAALALAFLATVHQAIFPTRCRVDGEGVARRLGLGWERRPWESIRSATLGRGGLFVSPGMGREVLATFRGLWLPLPSSEAEALVGELRRRLAARGLA